MPSRCKQLDATSGRLALLNHPDANLDKSKVDGPLPFCNPTRAQFLLPVMGASLAGAAAPSSTHSVESPSPDGPKVAWRARDNRKGRHVLVLPKGYEGGPALTTTWSAVSKGIWRMCTVYAWWDISWWIAVLFTVGSAIFVMDGFFYWLPLADPSSSFKGEGLAGGICSLVGATLFTIGGVLLIPEATNENQSGCFGWALEHTFSHHSDDDAPEENGSSTKDSGKDASTKAHHVQVSKQDCAHHHGDGLHRKSVAHMQHPDAGRKWEWWPTWYELKTHYFHEIGFMASFTLAIGAVIFYISGIMAMPQIYDKLSQGVLYGVYWLAYLVGGVFFVIASALYVLETQPNWYTPAPRVLGWHIGVWNLIGSVGWALSASFGYCSASWCAYQSNLTLIWASIAFLIGSALLWYEALDKYPVVQARS